MVTVIVALVLRRFLHTQVRQELSRQAVALDMEQAKVLQQRVLVPEVLHSPVFSVESEYHPAQTVGGDFFQTLSKPDGSLLVVVGDVSGKGMSAAMLVAVLVGAIRTRADESFDPTSMLTMLNQRLIGRSGGHLATCLVAELRPDGTMHVANAGHLPPYLNGEELDLEGSLPLGAANAIEFSSRIVTPATWRPSHLPHRRRRRSHEFHRTSSSASIAHAPSATSPLRPSRVRPRPSASTTTSPCSRSSSPAHPAKRPRKRS